MVEHRILTDEELEEHDRRQDLLEYVTALAVQPSNRPSSATAAILRAQDGPRLSDLMK